MKTNKPCFFHLQLWFSNFNRLLMLVCFFFFTGIAFAQKITGVKSLFDIGSGFRERSNDVTIDNSGNTIITGYTRNKPDFDLAGGNFEPANGNIPGYFLIKYNMQYQPMWGYQTGYFDSEMMITNLKTDNNNRVIIAGLYRGFNSDIDFSTGVALMPNSIDNNYSFFVAVYDSSGNFICHNEIMALQDSLNIMIGDHSWITDLTTDNANNIFIAGYCGDVMLPAGNTSDTLKEFNYFLAKYDSNCVLQWLHYLPKEVKEFHNWTNGRPINIDVDDVGNLYYTLTFSDSINLLFENEVPQYIAATPYDYSWNPASHESTNYDFVIIKYNTNGHYLKHYHFNAPVLSRQRHLDVITTDKNRIVLLGCFDTQFPLPDGTLYSVGFDSYYNYNLVLLELDTALNIKKHQRYYNTILSPRAGNNYLAADKCGNILLRCNMLEANGFPFPPFATNDYPVLSCENLYVFNSNLELTDSIEANFEYMSDFSSAAIQYGKINLYSSFEQSYSLGSLTVQEHPSATGQTEFDIYLAELSYNACSKILPNNPGNSELQFPNIFTPNGDGYNELFAPTVIENVTKVNLSIYNRWGKTVFKSGSKNQWWDGKTNSGNECTDGVYFFIADYSANGVSKSKHGAITLLK